MSYPSSKPVYLKVTDHAVSQENFELHYNEELQLLETFPQPTADKLPDYYKSDDYISHTDGKRNLFEKLYQWVKGIALKRKLNLIHQLSPHKGALLDIGCGTGDFLKVVEMNGWRVAGIEPNAKARQIATSKITATVYDTKQLSKFEDGSFDVITLWHVLEHLPDLEMHFYRFHQLLKPNGSLVIAVPNYNSFDAQWYKEFWAAYDVPRHLWHFSQHAIKLLGAQAHLSVTEIHPMKFDAYYVSLLSEKYKSGKMNFLKGAWIGWRSNRSARRSGAYSSLIYVLKKQNL